ncbi:hypothetical protein [Bartonella taylorii]|uniref:hypothetical protein n=1 Tax=Bartonella taylorii TaxID=33046 RepID=UPI001ABB03F7|nr:hypothetical protein [Bartonella taylorii]
MVAPIIPMALVAGARFAPHIMRYLYPRVAPKAVTGAQRFGQFMKTNPKSAIATGGAMTLAPLMAPEEVHAPNNPYLQNMQQPYGPFMPYTSPRTEMPLGVGNHSPMPNALESTPQELKPHVNEQTQPLAPASPTPPPEPTDAEKFLQSNTYKFFQSDAYQKLQDLFAGMAAAPSGGSGWDALASGVKHLNEGDKQRRQVNQTVEYLKSKGYSEEEAAIMARNPQMLSAMLTGGDTPKLLPGHEWYTNPETGERGQRPIKGSLQELEYNQNKKEIEEWEINKRQFAWGVASEIDNAMGAVNHAINLIESNPNWVAGKGGTFAQIFPGSDAKTLKNLFTQIQGDVFKRVIASIKKQSKNGSVGVGPLSDAESKWLVSSYGTLDISDKPEVLHKTLSNIKKMLGHFQEFNEEEIYRLSNGMEVRRRPEPSAKYANQLMSQGDKANLPIVTSKEQEDALPRGTYFVDEDGKLRVKRD